MVGRSERGRAGRQAREGERPRLGRGAVRRRAGARCCRRVRFWVRAERRGDGEGGRRRAGDDGGALCCWPACCSGRARSMHGLGGYLEAERSVVSARPPERDERPDGGKGERGRGQDESRQVACLEHPPSRSAWQQPRYGRPAPAMVRRRPASSLDVSIPGRPEVSSSSSAVVQGRRLASPSPGRGRAPQTGPNWGLTPVAHRVVEWAASPTNPSTA